MFHSNFGRLAADLLYAKGHARSRFAFQDAALCDGQGHRHPDRDSYFSGAADPWYLDLRATRVEAGMTPGVFL